MIYHNVRIRFGAETVTLAIRSDNRYQAPNYDNFMEILNQLGSVTMIGLRNLA